MTGQEEPSKGRPGGLVRIVMAWGIVLWGTAVAASAQVVVGEGIQPQVAVDRGGRAYVVYGTKGDGAKAPSAVWCASSTNGGKAFFSPVKVAEATDLPLGKRRGPRVATAGGAVVVTAVVDKEVVRWRSVDGGRSWPPSLRITDSPAAAREGFNTIASDGGERMFAAWLDMRAGAMQVWGASSDDGGKTFGRNVRVYASLAGHVCECCSVSAAFTPAGEVLVMFRNWDGTNRDLYLARSADGAQTFSAVKLGAGTWALNACPMDGGSVTAAADGHVYTIWRRQSKLYLARPDRPGEETALAEGMQPVVAAVGGEELVAWITQRPGELIYALGGCPSEVIAHNAGDPFIAALRDGKSALLTWEEGGKVMAKAVP